MISVVDWLRRTVEWGYWRADRPRGLIRLGGPTVMKSEGRGFMRSMMSRRANTDPAASRNPRGVQPGPRVGADAPSPSEGVGTPSQAMATSSGAEDPERDRALMRLVCDHEEAALAALYDRYAGLVNGLALSILHNSSLAEEATHDVFLRIWQQPTAYDPARGSFAGWLLRVARNRSIDLLRRRREDPLGTLDVEGGSWIADPAPGPEEQAMTQLRRQEVRRALDELEPDHRQLLELAYYTGLSQSQIAEHLGRPLGTVKSQIRSAMLRLADRLSPADSLSRTRTTRTLPAPDERS